MTKFKDNWVEICLTLLIAILISTIANLVGYGYTITESIPGLLILALMSLAGYFLAYVIPFEKISAVLWISIIAILLASPISPLSGFIIYHVGNVHLMSVVTPILAYAGAVIAKDWGAFRQIGWQGIVVSVFVMAGTFLISSLIGDFFMRLF